MGPSILEERLHRLQTEGAAASGQPAPAGSAPAAGPSAAERGDLSVAEIKARKAAEAAGKDSAAQAEIDALVEKARGAEAEGKPAVARLYLQMAARRAEGEQRGELLKQIQRLEATK